MVGDLVVKLGAKKIQDISNPDMLTLKPGEEMDVEVLRGKTVVNVTIWAALPPFEISTKDRPFEISVKDRPVVK
jgi:hypothetical protein